MNEEIEKICFEIITNVGISKGYFISAIKTMKVENDLRKTLEFMKKGEESLVIGHKSHAELLKLDSKGNINSIPLLVMHAEDQLMSVETIKMFAEEIIDLYQCLEYKPTVVMERV